MVTGGGRRGCLPLAHGMAARRHPERSPRLRGLCFQRRPRFRRARWSVPGRAGSDLL